MDKNIKIAGKTVEEDIVITLPDGREVLVQYRNYEGDNKGNGASLDIILPKPMNVYNWIGTEMKPAKIVGAKEIHLADQLCIPL